MLLDDMQRWEISDRGIAILEIGPKASTVERRKINIETRRSTTLMLIKPVASSLNPDVLFHSNNDYNYSTYSYT